MLHEDPGNISYSSVGGLSDQIRELRESIELPLMNPELFLRVGIKPPKVTLDMKFWIFCLACLLFGRPCKLHLDVFKWRCKVLCQLVLLKAILGKEGSAYMLLLTIMYWRLSIACICPRQFQWCIHVGTDSVWLCVIEYDAFLDQRCCFAGSTIIWSTWNWQDSIGSSNC